MEDNSPLFAGQIKHIDQLVDILESRYALFVSVAKRHAPAPDMIYDIIQQAFIDFLQGYPEKKWDLNSDITPLIVRFVKDRARLAYRERKRGAPEVLDTIAQRFLALHASRNDKEIENNLAAETAALNICLEKLPRRSRDWIRKHYFVGLTMQEIGEQEKTRPGTVRQTFSRIRLVLRKCIEQRINLG